MIFLTLEVPDSMVGSNSPGPGTSQRKTPISSNALTKSTLPVYTFKFDHIRFTSSAKISDRNIRIHNLKQLQLRLSFWNGDPIEDDFASIICYKPRLLQAWVISWEISRKQTTRIDPSYVFSNNKIRLD